jgi:hypothetical protein
MAKGSKGGSGTSVSKKQQQKDQVFILKKEHLKTRLLKITRSNTLVRGNN